jgi:hypothetical protein
MRFMKKSSKIWRCPGLGCNTLYRSNFLKFHRLNVNTAAIKNRIFCNRLINIDLSNRLLDPFGRTAIRGRSRKMLILYGIHC